MDIAAILREVDAEIEKLERIRTVIEQLLPPVPRKTIKAKRQKPVQQIAVISDPKPTPPPLVIVPPKVKREYRPRHKVTGLESRALASVIPHKPVFVPRAEVVARPELVIKGTEFAPEALETALRRNLLSAAS